MTTYDALFDRVLTRVDPERAHRLGFRAIRVAAPLTRRLSTRTDADPSAREAQEYAPARRPPVTAMGLEFPNRLGLAAGFDKNAVGIDGSLRSGSASSRSAPSPHSRSPATRSRGCSGCRRTTRS